MVWIEYAICAVSILVSGSLLSRYADILSEKTGMGRTWTGLILLATVTSLPELATGVSAVTVVDVPEIAAGNILGACVLNLMMVGLLDLFCRPAPVLSRVDQGQILSAGFGTLLIGVTAWGIHFGKQEISWDFWIGPTTLPILILYFVAIRMVFRFERRRMAEFIKEQAEALSYQDVPIRNVYLSLFFHGAVIVGAGIWLSFLGERIAETTGWGITFVGSLVIAFSTTLPEMVTSFSALRLGAPDLAVANIFGSNLFNIAILAVDDLVYTKGPLLSQVSSNHLFSAITAVMMTSVAIAGLIFRDQNKAWLTLTWTSMALLFLYLLNAYLLFALGKGAL